jgi:hypothetical protein
MPDWTQPAREEVRRYYSRVRASLAESGADPDEVIGDLDRHIDEEITAARLGVVTEEDARRILARIGPPDSQPSAASRRPAPVENNGLQPKPTSWRLALLMFGVVLPAITLAFEYFTGMCAALLFDPLPTVWHVLLVATVPLAGFLVWRAVRNDGTEQQARLGWLNGFAFGVALAYALVYLPLTPFAIPGLIVYGIGLLPLAPLLSLIATLQLRRLLCDLGDRARRLPGWWPGAGLAWLALSILALPSIVGEIGLREASSADAATRLKGIRWLRALGTEEVLLRACYGRPNRVENIYSFGEPVSPAAARTIYYLVTGRAFNTVPPPKLYAGRGRWRVLEEEFTWDNDQGGDAVAGRVKGLSLVNSLQDGSIDADAVIGYIEWTLEFKNVSALQREARAQIALPPGAVVSRLTLWIDGEEREAAFAGRSQVRTAYQEVVQQRRDPVLVTTCGPDRVLLQCYPVPANGGVMKCRVGITTPLVLNKAEEAFLRWPSFLERNFTIAKEFRHSVWIESKGPLHAPGIKLVGERGKDNGFALHGRVADLELAGPEAVVRASRTGEIRQAWVNDSRSPEPQIIRQKIVEEEAVTPGRVVIVVDGTRGMDEFYPAIAEALSQLPDGLEVAVLLAADGVESICAAQQGDAALYNHVAGRLRKIRAVGGHDNVPALLRGWDVAAENPNGVLVWIHGPQPVLLDTAEELRQRFERRGGHPLLCEMQAQAGPNRIAEKLDGLPSVTGAPRLGKLSDDLAMLFNSWRGKSLRLARDRSGRDLPAASLGGKETSSHLARLWARDEAVRLAAARKFNEATQLAARYQLVTAVSGAVVLETKAQYERAGLKPVDAATVPVVPEPETWVLMLLGIVLFVPGMVRRRRRHRAV